MSRQSSNWITRLSSNDFTPRSSTLERGVVSRSCYRRSRYTVYRPSPFVTPPLRGWRENLQHLFALFSPPRAEREARREERSERAREESSFVTENLLRLSIIFNRENKSFDSIIRGISSCLPRGPPTSASNRKKKERKGGKKPSLCPA